jgi:hypothetical protein
LRQLNLTCADCSSAATAQAPALQQPTLQAVGGELQAAGGTRERLLLLRQYARELPRLPPSERTMANRVMGCTSQARRPCERLGAGGVA